MKKHLPNLFALCLLLLIPAHLTAQTGAEELEQLADSLYRDYREEEALKIYRRLIEEQPENFTALWRTSFLFSRVGNRRDSEEQQREYFNRAIELAERALAVDSTHTQSNFVMAVAMGRKALISGARSRVAASRDIKKYADRSLEQDPKNEGAWHVLGRWHFKVANLGWLERAAANTLFGGIPGDAGNDKAAAAIEKAIALNDRYILYYYDLARVYKEMDRDGEAVAICEKALDQPNRTVDDERIREDCRELIEDLN